jgi:hypothetical protein
VLFYFLINFSIETTHRKDFLSEEKKGLRASKDFNQEAKSLLRCLVFLLRRLLIISFPVIEGKRIKLIFTEVFARQAL